MTKLRHYDNLGAARFVTFSCFHRYQLLRDSYIIRAFLDERSEFRHRGVRLLGYVVMPEHVHLVLLPNLPMQLGREIGKLKSLAARRLLPMMNQLSGQRLDHLQIRRGDETRTVFWQRRSYDHNCRTEETVREKIEYCHKNPVTRGPVRHPGDRPWSSYRWYTGLEGIELEIDSLQF